MQSDISPAKANLVCLGDWECGTIILLIAFALIPIILVVLVILIALIALIILIIIVVSSSLPSLPSSSWSSSSLSSSSSSLSSCLPLSFTLPSSLSLSTSLENLPITACLLFFAALEAAYEHTTPMLPTPDLCSGIPFASPSLEPPVLAPTLDFDPTSAYTHCIG
ncbi:uncharacterized protein EI90DRAFT_3121036 [Cantharellus anzutake]|uniref:uncharacterized protein n=1 Tax=Cantharellus anzutake TaxID=1750568 RepID=UPI0019035A6C|nr:uncharacterized protein EI90DRAFT_3121036 [Cantharellus anzutake]KAF8334616.1 hypothetical protein EI90DRAFT_3121036 [Cantharellus anzutake]